MTLFRSYRVTLQAAFLALALFAIAATYWSASIAGTAALRQTTIDRLTAVRETKRRAVEDYFADLTDRVLALSTDESSIAALEGFRDAWPRLPALPPDDPRVASLDGYYRELFAPRVRHQMPAAEVMRTWFPGDGRTRALQHHVISGSEHGVGAKDLLLSPGTGTPYDDIHTRYHPTFSRYQTAFGFYDIFLIDARDGRILYTVFKEVDIGFSLAEAPYRQTTLARVFERALSLRDGTVIEDYARYMPSYYAPAAFIGAPIRRGGTVIGVLAVQVSIERVNRVMTGDQAWAREGFGRTGHAYIVGADRTLRTDLRFETEQPEQFFEQIRRAGMPPAMIERTRRDGTAILNLSLSGRLAPRIFDTAEGTDLATDVRGVEVIRSHAALRQPGLPWVLVAEMETAEAFAPIAALRHRFLVTGAGIAVLFAAAAWVLARQVTQPVTALVSGTRRLAGHDFDVRLPVASRGEFGELARAFNDMAERLQVTTVSRNDLDRVNRELVLKGRELEQLHARLVDAQEDERRRLARELHDDLTQRLAAVAIEAGALKLLPDDDAGRWRAGLRSIQEQLAQISRDVHGLSRRLHPATLEDLGLVAALESECRGFFERGGPPVTFSHHGAIPAPAGDAGLTIYRVVQESLQNVAKHAGATEVRIDLQATDDRLRVRIEDDGRGFDKDGDGWRRGLGLASMDERARLAGGSLTVASRPGEGTTVTLTLPRREARP